jgi:fructokinase
MNPSYTIAGIGEILWDVFPTRQRLGGAPANFAIHCHQLGANAFPISALGADELGEAARHRLEEKGVNDTYVQTTAAWPTSRVLVTLDAERKPTYEIIENVAWDHLQLTDNLKQLAPTLDAVCFGVLCQRGEVTRRTVHAFLDLMAPGALKIFDINLRQAYFSKELVEQSLQRATVLKLSDEELPQLAKYFGLEGSIVEQLRELHTRFQLDIIAYTRGPDGCLLMSAETIEEAGAVPVTVMDSVGAGDSFTAALCMGLVQHWPLCKVSEFANKVAAYVCSHEGATPALPADLISQSN